MPSKPSPSTAKGKGRAQRPTPTHFNLRGYENLRAEFINPSGELEYVFRFERVVNDTPEVYFEIVRLEQSLSYSNVVVPPNRKLKTRTVKIPMQGEHFEVEFSIDDQPFFVVQIDSDGGETAAWITSFDAGGFELTALLIENLGAVHLRDFGKGGV